MINKNNQGLKREISIVIPAYNEEKRIGGTLQDYLGYYKNLGKDFEIIVVLNGCCDRTEEIVDSFLKQYPSHVKKEVFHAPIGKGGALIEGVSKARGKIIAHTDADGATLPQELHKLIQIIETKQADLVIGSRWIEGATVIPKQPLKRRIASRCYNFLVRCLFNLPFKDTQYPAKAISKDVLSKIQNGLHIADMSFDINLIFSVLKNKKKIKEIPIYWQDKEGSKVKLVKTSLLMFRSLIRLRMIYSPLRFLVPYLQIIAEPVRKKLSGWPTSDYRVIRNLLIDNPKTLKIRK